MLNRKVSSLKSATTHIQTVVRNAPERTFVTPIKNYRLIRCKQIY